MIFNIHTEPSGDYMFCRLKSVPQPSSGELDEDFTGSAVFGVYGINCFGLYSIGQNFPAHIVKLLEQRETFRANKQFSEADALTLGLSTHFNITNEKGVVIVTKK